MIADLNQIFRAKTDADEPPPKGLYRLGTLWLRALQPVRLRNCAWTDERLEAQRIARRVLPFRRRPDRHRVEGAFQPVLTATLEQDRLPDVLVRRWGRIAEKYRLAANPAGTEQSIHPPSSNSPHHGTA